MIELRRRYDMAKSANSNVIINRAWGDNDAALMDVIYAKGWSASPDYMTKEEAEVVNTIGARFSGNLSITDFSALEYFTGITTLDGAFKGCTNLVSVKIPSGITMLKGAFDECTNLQLGNLPDTITSIDYYAFEKCSSITMDRLPTNLSVLGVGSFSDASLSGDIVIGCNIGESSLWRTNIKSLTINGATTIGRKACQYCTSLECVYMGDSVTSMGDHVFSHCESLKTIRLSNNLTSIPRSTFIYAAFENIDIPNSVTSIGQSAFQLCRNLKKVIIPESVTSLEGGTFTSCESLAEVVLPNTLQRLNGAEIFRACTSLKRIDIPASVVYIAANAFYRLTAKIVLHNPIPCEIGGDILGGWNATIYVPDDSLTAYQTADIWADFADKIKPMSQL